MHHPELGDSTIHAVTRTRESLLRGFGFSIVICAFFVGGWFWHLHSEKAKFGGEPLFRKTLMELQACQALPVSVSPDGRLLLLKSTGISNFTISVLDLRSGAVLASETSTHTTS
jgi:hypothetical protein